MAGSTTPAFIPFSFAPSNNDGTSICNATSCPGIISRPSEVHYAHGIHVDVIPEHNPPGMWYNGYYWANRQLFPAGPRIKNLADMVNQLLQLVNGGSEKIERLTIFGHGDSTGFYIGEDWIGDDELKRNDLATSFIQLQGSFTPNALVVLHACNLGESAPLLRTLSGLLGGVRVRAGTAKQLPMRKLLGTVRTCTLTMCTEK